MSFQKMNLCESTQVAMNVFHMFRNNTVNLVNSFSDSRNGVVSSQYEGGDYIPEEGEVRPYDNDMLKEIASLLKGDYANIRVHDVTRTAGRYAGEFSERRLVQFYVTERGDNRKIIVSILVTQEYYEEGMTPWHVENVEIKVATPTYKFSRHGQGGTKIINLRQTSEQDLWLSEQVKQNVRGFLCFY
jgi:hypothetical protein